MRRIRVHLPGVSTFIVGTSDGIVVECSRPECGDQYLGADESVVAAELRAEGATFVDLDHDRTEVRVARGYRARDTSVPYSSPRKPSPRKGPLAKLPPDAPKPAKRAKPGKTATGPNGIVESLKANKPPKDDPDCPF
jgi:hypothetical protein